MHVPLNLFAVTDLPYVWDQATPEGKAIIVVLVIFSIFAWSVMASKAVQMRRAKRLNAYFEAEFRTQRHVVDVYDRRIQVPDCPLYVVYQEGCRELEVEKEQWNGVHESLKRLWTPTEAIE